MATPRPSPTSPAPSPPGPRRPLLETRFIERARYHPLEIVATGFVLASRGSGRLDSEERHEVELPAPYVAVEVDLDGGDGIATAGLASRADSRALRAVHDARTGTLTLELVSAGRTQILGTSTRAAPKGAFTLGFALCENQATVLVRPAGGAWRAVLTARDRVADTVDFRDPAVLAGLAFVWGARTGTVSLTSARGGLFGMTGLRDPHLVQNADGSPHIVDGRLFMTWTCAGPGFFQQAHWGVFSFDPERPRDMRQVAQIYTRRDGLLLGDHAGQIVRDGDRWLVGNTSWGDYDGSGVHIRHTSTRADLLRGVHVLETDRLRLPTDLDTWDPSLTSIDGSWWWAYVQSPSQAPFDFRPALARTSAKDPFHDLEDVGADQTRHQTEGTILARDRDRWLVLASDGDLRQYPAYDLDMNRVGRIEAPYGTNIPHPQTVVRADGSWMIVTFDATNPFADRLGYGGHGDVVILGEG